MMFSKSFVTTVMMMIMVILATSAWTSSASSDFLRAPEAEELFANTDGGRSLRYKHGRHRSVTINVDLNVTNLSFQQPFGPFFVMVHNGHIDPIFTLGMPSSKPLQELAENGSPAMLVDMYKNDPNVFFVEAMGGVPAAGKETFTVPVNSRFLRMTVASMAVNTNDCFVALNNQRIYIGDFNSPGYDSGTEENNESCSSIPGPACPMDSGNVASGNGEGVVHIHRGFHGVGDDLSEAGYDWRNPMLRVEIGHSMKSVMAKMKHN